MDAVTIEKSGEHFRILYDVKGRFTIHRISAEEASYKLCKVRKVQLGPKGVPYVVTHDGRTIRYPDPVIRVNDTIKFDFEKNAIVDHIKFEAGNVVMVTGGRNMGRAGVIAHKERHLGGFDIVHVTDILGKTFATRLSNVFVIGEGSKPSISLPKGKGTKVSTMISSRIYACHTIIDSPSPLLLPLPPALDHRGARPEEEAEGLRVNLFRLHSDVMKPHFTPTSVLTRKIN